MAKNIYLYSSIYSSAIERVNMQLDEIDESEDITYRINSGGGEVSAGFAFLSRISERKGANDAIVDGDAKSMAAYWLPFFNDVVANDTSSLMFHKAAYPSWHEPSPEEQESLDKTNDLFEEKMRAKVSGKPGAEKFLKKLFDKTKRNDVELTAYEAKKLGIVSKVRKLEPTAYSGMTIVAMVDKPEEEIEARQVNTNNNKNSNMELTPEELNAKLAEARKQGAKAENVRCKAWAKFATIAPKRVQESIESMDAEFDAVAMADMGIAMMQQEKTNAHIDDNEKGVDTDSQDQDQSKAKKEAESKEMTEALGKHGIELK